MLYFVMRECFKQNASKIVKISQQITNLWRKLKWLVFFWDTAYVYCLIVYTVGH